jgi:hypothetical protein
MSERKFDVSGVDYSALDEAIAKRVEVMRPYIEQQEVEKVAELIANPRLIALELAGNASPAVRARLDAAFELRNNKVYLSETKKRPLPSFTPAVMKKAHTEKKVVFAADAPLATVQKSVGEAEALVREKIQANKGRLDELTERIETATDKQRPFMEAETRRLQQEQQKLHRELKTLSVPAFSEAKKFINAGADEDDAAAAAAVAHVYSKKATEHTSEPPPASRVRKTVDSDDDVDDKIPAAREEREEDHDDAVFGNVD